jgi:hypothetical protein
MTAGGISPVPRPQYPQMPYAQQPPMPRPRGPRRPAVRLVAAILWLAAAGLGVGALFGTLYERSFPDTQSVFISGFWKQVIRNDGAEVPNGTGISYGIGVVAGAVILVLAAVLMFVSLRRWAAVVTGTFATAVLATEGLVWLQDGLAVFPDSTTTIKSGLWLLTASAAVALIALVIALTERTQPVMQPPPVPFRAPPPPQPRWEPQTPRFGIPVQQQLRPRNPHQSRRPTWTPRSAPPPSTRHPPGRSPANSTATTNDHTGGPVTP